MLKNQQRIVCKNMPLFQTGFWQGLRGLKEYWHKPTFLHRRENTQHKTTAIKQRVYDTAVYI